jgi:aminomethyltransferase
MANRTPLYDWHAAQGARIVDFAGWDMPIQYSTIIDEHTVVRSAAGLFDISHMGRLSFGGPDALALIQQLHPATPPPKDMQVPYGLVLLNGAESATMCWYTNGPTAMPWWSTLPTG